MWYASPEFEFVVQQIAMLKRFRKMGWREAKAPKLSVHNYACSGHAWCPSGAHTTGQHERQACLCKRFHCHMVGSPFALVVCYLDCRVCVPSCQARSRCGVHARLCLVLFSVCHNSGCQVCCPQISQSPQISQGWACKTVPHLRSGSRA